MTDAADRLATALSGRYRIERELGGGGMSRVFLARELGLNREVVIKVLPDDVAAGVSLDRFSREIQLAASLQQANIVPLLAAGDAAGVPYYAMPYVQGESLRGRLSQSPRLTIAECVGILRDVARALSYAHARGVVHRDIKPDNVLLSHGAAVVTDFGIAKAVSASRTMGDAATLTQAGTSIGTPAYMAPEQIAGEANVDHRADLYAWACMAYELLTGEPPFVRTSAQRVLAAHLAETPKPLAERRADAPAPLARLVMRCLEKDPAARPATADEVLRDLDGVFTPGESPSTPAPARGAAAGAATVVPLWRRPPIIVGALAIAAVVVFALLRGRAPAAATPALPSDRSIAVMPLANLSGDKADDYFGIGLAEEITRALTKSGVRVIGRVSASALLAKGLDERAVAKELGVASLLTGSVQRAAGQIRINVALLSAADGAVHWTEKYDRPLTNVFAVQDEIAQSVSQQLLGSLARPGGRARAREETADPDAYALFLQGQVLVGRRTAQSLAQAIDVLERAVRRDTAYARARAMLALAYAVLPNYSFGDPDATYDKALATAAAALARDSSIAEAWTARAWVHAVRGAHWAADTSFRRAIALDSAFATAWGWHGLHAGWHGDAAEAHRRIARALALEPAAMIVRVWDAQVDLYERNFAASDTMTRRVLAMDSTFALAWNTRADALMGLGRYPEAVAILEQRVALLPPASVSETHAMLAYAYARAGDRARARAALDRLRALSGGRWPAMGRVAATLNLVGDHEDAVTVLLASVARHDPWVAGFANAETFDAMRKDARVDAALKKMAQW